MDLSIIIPVHNDLRIERCVKSIDEEVEVIAALNRPTKEVSDLVTKLGLITCEVGKNNLGMAYNTGLATVSNDLALFMDSDCVFESGAIRSLYSEFKIDPTLMLARGRVIFQSNSLETELTRRARLVNTTNVPYAFIPPLMLKKQVFEKINDGYSFAEDVVWCVDYEFELRRRKAGIPLKIVPDARIYHDPLSIKSDLKSAFMYGTGKRIRHERTGEKVDLIGVIKDPILKGVKEEGLVVGFYLTIWKTVLYTGYYTQKYFDVQRKLGNRK
ncbi:MAG: glycosyltransferase [Nanoarchaeota archaeon]|nr:glycosyltransferase [Nanoarchaeota archaeon]